MFWVTAVCFILEIGSACILEVSLPKEVNQIDIQKKGSVIFFIVSSKYNTPTHERAHILTLHNNGEISDMDFHFVDDRNLKIALNTPIDKPQ
jgi:hypothetical protein